MHTCIFWGEAAWGLAVATCGTSGNEKDGSGMTPPTLHQPSPHCAIPQVPPTCPTPPPPLQVRTASCSATSCTNSFGDEQLAVDMLADKLLFEALRFSGVCKLACSEEVPEPLDLGGEGALLGVCVCGGGGVCKCVRASGTT
jgi:hypothetical protein